MKPIYRILIFIIFLAVLGSIILYARGYRLDFKQKSVTPTGIFAITSNPKAVKIYISDLLRAATDSNITLPPGQYKIELKKEGYTSWTKTLILKGEWVVSVDATLFPINPSLSPLTNTGIVKTIPVDQSEKVIIFTLNNNPLTDGIYLFDKANGLISFTSPLKLIILRKDLAEISDEEYTNPGVNFSPDYKQAIFDFEKINFPRTTISYLFSLDSINFNPYDISSSKLTLLEAWAREKNRMNDKILETYPKELVKIASDSFKIIAFSPDETKILYQANSENILPPIITPPLIATNQTLETRTLKKDGLYVYDKKEDKNYQIRIGDFPIWYYDSQHLMFIENIQSNNINNGTQNRKKISIIEYDDTNKQTVYSGPFENEFFTTTSDGKLIILTTLNPDVNPLPDLYLIGIR